MLLTFYDCDDWKIIKKPGGVNKPRLNLLFVVVFLVHVQEFCLHLLHAKLNGIWVVSPGISLRKPLCNSYYQLLIWRILFSTGYILCSRTFWYLFKIKQKTIIFFPIFYQLFAWFNLFYWTPRSSYVWTGSKQCISFDCVISTLYYNILHNCVIRKDIVTLTLDEWKLLKLVLQFYIYKLKCLQITDNVHCPKC